MRKKVKTLELENEYLRKRLSSHGLLFFILGTLVGIGLTMLKVDSFFHGGLLEKFNKAIYKGPIEVDQETMEVLEAERDNFE